MPNTCTSSAPKLPTADLGRPHLMVGTTAWISAIRSGHSWIGPQIPVEREAVHRDHLDMVEHAAIFISASTPGRSATAAEHRGSAAD
jgi:hypothetical protein